MRLKLICSKRSGTYFFFSGLAAGHGWVERTIDSISWFVVRLVGWLVDQLVDCLVVWWIDWLVGSFD